MSMLVVFLTILSTIVGASAKYVLDHDTDFAPFVVNRKLTWKAYTSLDDPANWQPHGRLPCPRDEVVFPPNYAVFLNRKLVVSKVILDRNGEVVLGSGNSIQFSSSEPSSKCASSAGETVKFVPAKNTSWFATQHWLLTSKYPSGNNRYDPTRFWQPISNYATHVSLKSVPGLGVSPLIPDIERVPCNGDRLYFPIGNGSFKVMLDRVDILPLLLGSVSIGNTAFLTTSDLRNFFSSGHGKMLFWKPERTTPNVRVSPRQALNEFNYCGNDRKDIQKVICSHSICPKLTCRDPIKPVGHCCPVCASSLLLAAKKPLKSGDMKSLHEASYRALKTIQSKTKWKVRFYAHWLSRDTFQILVDDFEWALAADRPDGRDRQMSTESYIDDFYDLLLKIYPQLESKYKIKQRESSSNFVFEHELFDSILFLVAFLFVVTPLVTLLLTIGACRYYQRNRTDPAFTFVRFQSQTHDIELDIDPQIKNLPQ